MADPADPSLASYYDHERDEYKTKNEELLQAYRTTRAEVEGKINEHEMGGNPVFGVISELSEKFKEKYEKLKEHVEFRKGQCQVNPLPRGIREITDWFAEITGHLTK